MMKATVYPSPDGWRWRIQDGNDDNLALSGKAYVRREDCEHVLLVLLSNVMPIEVIIRGHGGQVIGNYALLRGRRINEDLDTVYEGPLEDTNEPSKKE